MPVKVRCPGCRKVLTAPDAARGKALKCPECETKVRVPEEGGVDAGSSGKGTAKPKPKAKTIEDDEDLLSKLDVSKAVDTGASMCPKCGAEIPEGDEECPKCGVDPTTGQLSKAAKRRKSFKGVDPKEFFKVVWSDSWRFSMENFVTIMLTMFYQLFFLSLQGCCSFMVQWCSDTPPKAFWAFLGVLSSLAYPGWIWHLNVETIKLTTVKKSSMKDVKFDMFTAFALGIKVYVWILSHIWMPFGLLCLPISLIHFAMPVSGKAWLAPFTMKMSLKHFGAVAYYWVIRFVITLVASIAPLIVVAIYFKPITEAMEQANYKDIETLVWILVSIAVITCAFLSSFMEVFMARVNGLIAFYFRDTLELQTVVAEKKYVKKQVKLDKFGNPIKSPLAVWGPVVFALIGVLLAGNVICYYATGKQHFLMPDSWARGLGILD